MTTNLTHLPCDLDFDPAEPYVVPAPPPAEPTWFSAVNASARIDAHSRVTVENVTDYAGAPFLRVTVASEQGGVFLLEMSTAGQASLAKAIAGAAASRLVS